MRWPLSETINISHYIPNTRPIGTWSRWPNADTQANCVSSLASWCDNGKTSATSWVSCCSMARLSRALTATNDGDSLLTLYRQSTRRSKRRVDCAKYVKLHRRKVFQDSCLLGWSHGQGYHSPHRKNPNFSRRNCSNMSNKCTFINPNSRWTSRIKNELQYE